MNYGFSTERFIKPYALIALPNFMLKEVNGNYVFTMCKTKIILQLSVFRLLKNVTRKMKRFKLEAKAFVT